MFLSRTSGYVLIPLFSVYRFSQSLYTPTFFLPPLPLFRPGLSSVGSFFFLPPWKCRTYVSSSISLLASSCPGIPSNSFSFPPFTDTQTAPRGSTWRSRRGGRINRTGLFSRCSGVFPSFLSIYFPRPRERTVFPDSVHANDAISACAHLRIERQACQNSFGFAGWGRNFASKNFMSELLSYVRVHEKSFFQRRS